MVRRVLSLILISLFVIQPASVFAHEPDASRTLQEILTDIPKEASRFSRTHPLEVVETQDGGRSGYRSNQEKDTEQIRKIVLAIPVGTEVTVTLSDGEVVQGELAGAAEYNFQVKIPVPDDSRLSRVKKLNFDQVVTIIVGLDPREIPVGKRIEIQLIGGDKVTGHLTAASDFGVTVDDRQFSMDEIAGAKKLGMPGIYKGLIAGEIVFGR